MFLSLVSALTLALLSFAAAGRYGAGRHAVQADVAGFASGIYVVRAEARLPGGAIEVAARAPLLRVAGGAGRPAPYDPTPS